MNTAPKKKTWLGWTGLVIGGILWFAHIFHLPFFVMMFLGIGTSHIAMHSHLQIAGIALTIISVAWLVYLFFFKETCCKTNRSL